MTKAIKLGAVSALALLAFSFGSAYAGCGSCGPEAKHEHAAEAPKCEKCTAEAKCADCTAKAAKCDHCTAEAKCGACAAKTEVKAEGAAQE